MPTVEGRVEMQEPFTKPGAKWKIHSVKINGNYFQLAAEDKKKGGVSPFAVTKIPFNDGDVIRGEYTTEFYNGKEKHIMDISTVTQGVASNESSASVGASGGGGSRSTTQNSIEYQAARKAAIAVLDMLYTHGLIEKPKVGKKGDTLEVMLAQVNQVAEEFYLKGMDLPTVEEDDEIAEEDIVDEGED